MEEKKNFGKKITGALSKLRFNFKDQVSQIQNGGKSLVITVIVAFIIMILAFLAVFFLTVQGAEKVMVPNVVGKNLTNALLDLQSKELYGKIQLRYSDLPGDQGTILEQSPDAGAIVKAYRRVTLTVSRGVAIDELADYTGENIDDIYTAAPAAPPPRARASPSALRLHAAASTKPRAAYTHDDNSSS